MGYETNRQWRNRSHQDAENRFEAALDVVWGLKGIQSFLRSLEREKLDVNKTRLDRMWDTCSRAIWLIEEDEELEED